MATASNDGWKTCSRGHKYRGKFCPICWKAGAKSSKKRKRPARS